MPHRYEHLFSALNFHLGLPQTKNFVSQQRRVQRRARLHVVHSSKPAFHRYATLNMLPRDRSLPFYQGLHTCISKVRQS